MPAIIKRATAEDAAVIAQIFDEYRVFYEQPSDIPAAENFIRERLLTNESVIFLAFADDEAIGFTQLYPIFTSLGLKRAWLLNDLFVQEKSRKKGIATMLLEAAEEYAKKTNSKWLMLQTHCDNYTAQALYEKNGWEKIDDFFYSFNVHE